MSIKLLLGFLPVSVVLAYVVHASAPWVFLCALLALIPLADQVRKATEEISAHVGSSIGGLLNVTFGNAPELILALFVLKAGQAGVAQAQITGSIIGNSLLGLGLAALLGGFKKTEQKFSKARASMLGTLLVISLVGLVVPAAFDFTERALRPSAVVHLDRKLSIAVAVVLLVVYVLGLVYSMVTHKDLFSQKDEHHHQAEWSVGKSLAVLVGATVLVAFMSELISGSIEETATHLGLTKFFLGITVLAVVGNAAEYISAVYFARRDRMDLVMTITVGSSIQIALLVAPVLVLASASMGHPMTLVFTSPLELIALAAAAMTVNTIADDGETNWFEGAMLLAAYVILAVAFYFVLPAKL